MQHVMTGCGLIYTALHLCALRNTWLLHSAMEFSGAANQRRHRLRQVGKLVHTNVTAGSDRTRPLSNQISCISRLAFVTHRSVVSQMLQTMIACTRAMPVHVAECVVSARTLLHAAQPTISHGNNRALRDGGAHAKQPSSLYGHWHFPIQNPSRILSAFRHYLVVVIALRMCLERTRRGLRLS